MQSPIVADGDPVVNKEEKVPSLMERRPLREIDMKLCVTYFKQRSLITIMHEYKLSDSWRTAEHCLL